MDPIETKNEDVQKLKNMLEEIISGISSELKFHDFRITKGPLRTNLIFDLEIPFGFSIKDNDILKQINEEVKKVDKKFYIVPQIDRIVV